MVSIEVSILEILTIVAVLVSIVLYNKGMVGWSKKMKYAIYALSLLLATTQIPMLYGISFFFDCNWSTGFYQRDSTMMCWNFITGSGEVAIGLFISCFFLKKELISL